MSIFSIFKKREFEILEYYIVREDSEGVLVRRVGEMLPDGWEPVGGISVTPRGPSGGSTFWQAMILIG